MLSTSQHGLGGPFSLGFSATDGHFSIYPRAIWHIFAPKRGALSYTKDTIKRCRQENENPAF